MSTVAERRMVGLVEKLMDAQAEMQYGDEHHANASRILKELQADFHRFSLVVRNSEPLRAA